jgi:maleamate amidohydrolase
VTGPHGAAFSGRVGWGRRPAVVVVDLVRAYTEPDGPFALPEPGPAVAATAQLVDAARVGGHPVIWMIVRYCPGLTDGGLFVRKVPALAAFAEDADGRWGELALEPAQGEPVVVKQYASAFFGTSLAATLHAGGVDTVVVAGVSTSGCVRATATDALAHGFHPQVVREGCADRTTELHEQNLRDLDAKYADVADLAEALAHLATTRCGPGCGGGRRGRS